MIQRTFSKSLSDGEDGQTDSDIDKYRRPGLWQATSMHRMRHMRPKQRGGPMETIREEIVGDYRFEKNTILHGMIRGTAIVGSGFSAQFVVVVNDSSIFNSG